jgi:dihydrofolate reductase
MEKMKKISIIVAVAENNAIGKDNKLLWHISNDLKRFKRITAGHTVVMGKKTYESLPGGPLPDRRNIVISDNLNDRFNGCVMAYSINDALNKCDNGKENFIIGGGTIYARFLKYATKLYITRIHKSFNADTFFPELNYDEWIEIEKKEFPADEKNNFSYSFITYKRK